MKYTTRFSFLAILNSLMFFAVDEAPAAPVDEAAPAAPTEKAPKAEKAPKEPKEPRVEANGVVRPKDGTSTGRVWAIADEISAAKGAPAPRKEVMDQCAAEKINVSTAATQYGKWRKFHGLEREVKPATPVEAPVAAPETAPEVPAAE